MPGIQLIINLSTISNHKKKVLINASDQDYQTIFHFGMVHKLKVEWTRCNLSLLFELQIQAILNQMQLNFTYLNFKYRLNQTK